MGYWLLRIPLPGTRHANGGLVLPTASPLRGDAELSDKELETAAGGGWGPDTANDNTCNVGSTCGACLTDNACE